MRLPKDNEKPGGTYFNEWQAPVQALSQAPNTAQQLHGATPVGGAVRDAACASLGVALMATWCADDELRSGTLVPALPEYPLVSTQTLWALYPSSRELAPKVRVFIDWLVERFGGEPYWDRGLERIKLLAPHIA